MRTIDWRDGHIVAIDQTRLPAQLALLHIYTVEELIDAIKRLAIRGAPALGVAGPSESCWPTATRSWPNG